MSVKVSNDLGWFVSHEEYLEKQYNPLGLHFANVFKIETPFRMDAEAEKVARVMEGEQMPPQRKKKRKLDQSNEDFLTEKKLCVNFLDSLPCGTFCSKKNLTPDIVRLNNRPVRDLISTLENSTIDDTLSDLVPISSREFQSNSRSTLFVIPSESKFIMSDIRESQYEDKYDAIVIDPPWENKHVKRERLRSRGYSMMDNDQISHVIPIQDILSDDGVVLVWCTTSKRHLDAVRDWFRKWQLQEIGKWIWLKVTKYGEPVVDLNAAKQGKYAFEFILLGSKKKSELIHTKIICSIPSAIHSHKPPLIEVIQDTFGERSNGLELFGRNLLDGWTTIGNQCLKFQSRHYFYSAQN